MRLRILIPFLAVTALACQYVGAPSNSDTPGRGSAPAVTPLASTTPPLASTNSAPYATASAADLARAQLVLSHWHSVKANQPTDAVVVTDELMSGGGWNGPNADNDKVAVMSGALIANPPLATDVPPPAEVVFGDGTKQTLDLISAADALAAMNASVKQDCAGCTPVVVTGAQLSTAAHPTTHGKADLPAWQFEFRADDQPMDPLTWVAVKDVVSQSSDSLAPGDDGRAPIWIDRAYGNSASTQLGVTFTGWPSAGDKPCGGDYTAQAVESDEAVAIIVTESHRPGVSTEGACALVGAERTAVAQLERPLGNRVVLEIASGNPVEVQDGPEPTDHVETN